MKQTNTAKKNSEQERLAALPLDRSTLSLLKLLIARHWLDAHKLVYQLAPKDEMTGLFHQMARRWEALGIRYESLDAENKQLAKADLQWYIDCTSKHDIPVEDHFVRDVLASATQGVPMDRTEWKPMLEGSNEPTKQVLKAIAKSG